MRVRGVFRRCRSPPVKARKRLEKLIAPETPEEPQSIRAAPGCPWKLLPFPEGHGTIPGMYGPGVLPGDNTGGPRRLVRADNLPGAHIQNLHLQFRLLNRVERLAADAEDQAAIMAYFSFHRNDVDALKGLQQFAGLHIPAVQLSGSSRGENGFPIWSEQAGSTEGASSLQSRMYLSRGMIPELRGVW